VDSISVIGKVLIKYKHYITKDAWNEQWT
jgi:hypothetical protein